MRFKIIHAIALAPVISGVDELVKRHQRPAKKNVRVQGVANPEE
ncbi:hypothetical protein [Desulfatiferula olefinivorans]